MVRAIVFSDRLIRNPTVRFGLSDVAGANKTVLVNSITGNSFGLGKDEAVIWNMLDGTRTVGQLSQELRSREIEVDESSLLGFIQQLLEEGLVTRPGELQGNAPRRPGWFFEVFSIDARRISGVLGAPVRWIGMTRLTAASLAFVIVTLLLLFNRLTAVVLSSSTYIFLGSSVLGLLFFIFVLTLPILAIHELSHAIAAKSLGLEPSRFGFGILYLNPVFFTRIDDLVLANRRIRIIVTLAGPMSSIALGCLALVILSYEGPGPQNILSMVAFFCFSSGIINLAPFWRSDGYFIFCDILGTPHLGSDAWNVLRNLLRGNRLRTTSMATPARILETYLVIGVLYAAVVGVLNVTWVYQVLMGPDGIATVLTGGNGFSAGTLVGMAYLFITASLVLIQFSKRGSDQRDAGQRFAHD